jgi:hypothetical protein
MSHPVEPWGSAAGRAALFSTTHAEPTRLEDAEEAEEAEDVHFTYRLLVDICGIW